MPKNLWKNNKNHQMFGLLSFKLTSTNMTKCTLPKMSDVFARVVQLMDSTSGGNISSWIHDGSVREKLVNG